MKITLTKEHNHYLIHNAGGKTARKTAEWLQETIANNWLVSMPDIFSRVRESEMLTAYAVKADYLWEFTNDCAAHGVNIVYRH